MTGAVPLMTVSVVDPGMFPDVAVIVVVPVETEVASPLEPAALLMVATVVDDELQITDVVTFCVVLSEKVPAAVNCCVVPGAILGLAGMTAIDTSVADVTVNMVVPDMFVAGSVAVIVDEPVDTDVAKPLDPAALLMEATVVDDELQIADAVTFCVVLLEKVPVAVNCCVVPGAILGLAGITEMDTSVAPVVAGVPASKTPPEFPQPASSTMICKRSGILFDVTDHNSLRDQCRSISMALKVSHMSPFLHDNVVSFNLLNPLDVPAGHPALRFAVFIGVGTEQLRQVRVNQTVPGDAEYDARRGNLFSHSDCIGLKLLYGVVCIGHRRSAPCG